jgi:hypothetical protein
MKALRSMAEAKKAGNPISFVDALIKQGIPERVAQGLYRGEIGTLEEAFPVTKMQKLAYGAKWIPEKVYRFNSTIESFFRTAHYLDKVGKGFSIEQALASVNEFLFDYSALTPVEKAYFRRLDPFFNWHKNIIRLAVSYPIKYPQRFLLLQYANKLGTEIYEDQLRKKGVNPDDVPEYYKNMWLLPWKDEEGKDFYISLRGINPLYDVMPKFSDFHPLIQLVIEGFLKVNTFTGEDFSYPGKVYGSEKKKRPAIWRLILNKFPQFRTIEDLIRPYSIYDTGEPRLTKWGEPVYTKNRLLTILQIFAFKVTPRDIDEIYRKIKEERKAEEKAKYKEEQRQKLFKQKHPEIWYTE